LPTVLPKYCLVTMDREPGGGKIDDPLFPLPYQVVCPALHLCEVAEDARAPSQKSCPIVAVSSGEYHFSHDYSRFRSVIPGVVADDRLAA